jgi:two-component system, LytTR family, sensor kinase
MPEEEAAASSLTIDAETSRENRWKQLADLALGRYFTLLAWVALYFALGNAEAARAAERREGEFRRAAKASELRSLRYQVNPHFLFNTLNSLSALVMTGKAEAAEEMIQTLSTFYRRSLADDPTADLSLAEEVAMQRHYLGSGCGASSTFRPSWSTCSSRACCSSRWSRTRSNMRLPRGASR